MDSETQTQTGANMDTNYADLEAHNDSINAAADDACRKYYADNPTGNWTEATAIADAIRADLVVIPRGGYACY